MCVQRIEPLESDPMTKSEIMKKAHKEARNFIAGRALCWGKTTYAEALSVGLRRAHNDAMHAAYVAARIGQPATPKFMFLRGL